MRSSPDSPTLLSVASDEQSYPTAIVPAKPGSSIERYERYAKTFGDPMAKLFLLQNCGDIEYEFKAAAELMPYRYPKLKVSEVRHSGAPAAVNIQINMGGPPAPPPAPRAVAPAVDPLE